VILFSIKTILSSNSFLVYSPARPVPIVQQEGNYDCGTGRTLTFCFARPSRATQRQTLNPSKLPQHRHSATLGEPGDSGGE